MNVIVFGITLAILLIASALDWVIAYRVRNFMLEWYYDEGVDKATWFFLRFSYVGKIILMGVLSYLMLAESLLGYIFAAGFICAWLVSAILNQRRYSRLLALQKYNLILSFMCGMLKNILELEEFADGDT